ncbi:CheW-like protein [Prosthecobacter fusiformis]|uniref:CheW-like protein n=1 Tax=Prosthecobacter fusiformis TaxID=48464 RepID=A0A4V3FFM4_9BACT|nr:chemotaxis protein CheW [Prosthecobacter fusiformis]TDU71343.1 CheW-like protein [Prosthecobacter fusiformis]
MSETRNIDWQTAQQQLLESSLRVERAFTQPSEQVEEILIKRAEILAQRNRTQQTAVSHRPILLLQIGPHTAGIEVRWLKGVIRMNQEAAPVPDAHELLLGIINVQAELVNLINPWPLLHETPQEETACSHAVLIRHGQLKVAVACNGIIGLTDLPENAWQDERLFLHAPNQPPGVLLDIHSLLSVWEKDPGRPF